MVIHIKPYRYEPSLAAAIVFVVAFGLTTVLHTYQILRTKTSFFIAFAIGGWFEVIGYIGRIISVNEYPDNTRPPYAVYVLFPLIAPALYAASIYRVFGVILQVTNGEKYSIIKPSLLEAVFIFGDVASFVLVGVGGSMTVAAESEASINKGERIVTIGLIIQLLFFSFFIVMAGIFNIRMAKSPTETVQSRSDNPYQKHLYALYLAAFIILVRSVYKLIEYVQGRGGYLFSKEVFAYVFDAALMFFTMVIFHFVHPSELNALVKGGFVVSNVTMAKPHRDSDASIEDGDTDKLETKAVVLVV
ncbi:hypothetical protein H072_2261 [Dactylellina haptotyla CBS 200.50]|uniref:RTA1 like protein n=1 Tax=Dactylellina haptotyla (strain CBS 200.50) TaxID=1284197 RepID=S8BW78_DACHA|nr:hypothetical protein H072_2261 [Dactylellina haptotyla CBS 200.50]